MTTYVAGVDTSTQSCTVEIRALTDGSLAGSARTPHPPTYPPHSEQDPTQWWEALTASFPAACQNAGVSPAQIAAISVGGQCHGLVMLDRDDQVIRPAKLWNDTTSASQTRDLIAARGQERWLEEVLVPINSAHTITKLRWVAENEPENLTKIAKVMVPHDYLTYRLTGQFVTDRSDASGTGYYSAPEKRYRTDILDQYIAEKPWEDLLPRVLGPDEAAGTVSGEVCEQLGLPADCVVGVGGGDQHLAAVGMGLRQGETAFSLGTSGVVFTPVTDPVRDPQGRIDSVCDATGGYLPLLCTLNCTKVTDLFARLLDVDVETLDKMALRASESNTPREGLPTLLPYIDGERSPSRPRATGLLGGLRSSTSRDDLALAAFTGVVDGLVWGYHILQSQISRPIDQRFVIVGGGSKSHAYRQFLADRLGRAVCTVDAPEATARGACIQAAAVVTGKTVSAVRDAWSPQVLTHTEPRPGRKGVPQQFFDLFAAEDQLLGLS